MKKKYDNTADDLTRPYERCLHYGPGILTDEELLGVVFRCGMQGLSSVGLAKKVLELAGNRLNSLPALTVQELMQIPGVGKVKAVQVQAVCEMAKRMASGRVREGQIFASPAAVAEYYMEELRKKEKECLLMMMLDTKMRLIREDVMSVGTVREAPASVRELFIHAVRHKAVRIILIHNHPSGDPQPSEADTVLTEKAAEAGELMDIALADHIIIGDGCYFSYAEDGFFERIRKTG